MKSKFNQVFNSSYVFLFKEDAPPISPEDMEEGGEGVAPDPSASGGSAPEPPVDNTPEETSTQLPDPRENERVTIDMLNMFIDFANLPEEERRSFLKSYDFKSGSVNSDNYQSKLDALKAITKSDFPERTAI